MFLTRSIVSGLLCLLLATPLAAQQQTEPVSQEPVTETQEAAPTVTSETDTSTTAATESPKPEANSDDAAKVGADFVTAIDRDIRRSNFLPFPAPQAVAMLPGVEGWKPNTVSAPFPRELKSTMAQAGMAASPWSMRQMINFMSHKVKVKEGLTFEEVIEAMDSRAVDVNFKKVGFTHISKELTAKLGEQSPHIAILHYCDALVGRKIMDYSPEFSIFLPCRISLIQDGQGDLYLMTMDWDVTWLNYAWHPDSQLDAELKQDAVRIRDAMHSIMAAGANGDW